MLAIATSFCNIDIVTHHYDKRGRGNEFPLRATHCPQHFHTNAALQIEFTVIYFFSTKSRRSTQCVALFLQIKTLNMYSCFA